jgi:hypothetical protein
MVIYLSRALSDLCNRSRCLKRAEFVAQQDEIYQYPLFNEFLGVDACAYNDGRWYPLHRASLKSVLAARYLQESGTPRFFDVWGNSYIQRVTGVATGGSGTTLVDSTKNFTTGSGRVFVGDWVFNQTDDSEAADSTVAVSIVAATQLTFGQLAGGADNTFAVGDTYRVQSNHAPNQTLILHPAPADDDVVGTESIAVWGSVKHRVVSSLTDYLEIPPEFEPALLHRTMFWAQAEEKGFDSREATAQFTLYETSYKSNEPLVRNRIREEQASWGALLAGRHISITGAPEKSYPLQSITIN